MLDLWRPGEGFWEGWRRLAIALQATTRGVNANKLSALVGPAHPLMQLGWCPGLEAS